MPSVGGRGDGVSPSPRPRPRRESLPSLARDGPPYTPVVGQGRWGTNVWDYGRDPREGAVGEGVETSRRAWVSSRKGVVRSDHPRTGRRGLEGVLSETEIPVGS